MIIPVNVDVPMRRYPIANVALIGLISIISLLSMFGGELRTNPLVLDGWSLQGLVGSIFLHAGVIHLIGNMIFLWVFGNAVNAKLGNLVYPAAFLLLGILAGMTHLVMSDGPAVGASGAINGVVGMFLILYPLNNIQCIWFFFGPFGMTFRLSSIWMILFWLAWDILGASLGGGAVAYWAHLGGFAGGTLIVLIGLTTGLIEMTRTERSLLAIVRGETS
jgi:membrane associated rhomboid family serine protease